MAMGKCYLALLLAVVPMGFVWPETPQKWAAAATSPAALAQAEAVWAQLTLRDDAQFSMSNPILLESTPEAVTAWISSTEADALLLTGVLASKVIAEPGFSTEKPIVAGFFHDPALFDLIPDPLNRRPNVNLVLPAERMARDLVLLRELTGAGTIAVVLAEQLISGHALQGRLHEIGEALGLTLTALPAGSPEEVAKSTNAEAVYLGPLPYFTDTQHASLFEKLHERGIPTYAMSGIEAVNQGVFAGALQDAEKTVIQRLADHVHAVREGNEPEYLPGYVPITERLTINGRVAAALGYTADLDLRMRADILFPEGFATGQPLTLITAIETVLADNPDLEAQRQNAAGSDYARKSVFSVLLPQISADARHTRNNDDNPQIAAGLSPETQTTLNFNGSQVIFDDDKWTEAGVARLEAKVALTRVDLLTNDIIDETAAAYLDLLVNQALLDIEIENLKLTRSNLETARARVRLGASGKEERYRWESQVAQQTGNVYNAEARVTSARAGLERLLGKPMANHRLDTVTFTGEDTVFLSERWTGLMREHGAKLEHALIEIAVARSPDVADTEFQTMIAKRREARAKRSFFLPTINLEAGLTDFLDQEFLASDQGIPGLSLNQEGENWSVTLSASIPIFNGGRRVHELGRARAVRRETVNRKTASEWNARQLTRISFAAVRASYPNIELTRIAANSARENLNIVLARYSQGQASILDLLEAQEQDLARGRQAAVAEYNHLANLFALQRAISFYDWQLSREERLKWLDEIEAKTTAISQRRP